MKTISCKKCGKKKEVSSNSRSSYVCEECFNMPTIELICKCCGEKFKVRYHKTYQLYCSRSCKSKSLSSSVKHAISETMRILHTGSGNPMYGKSPSHTKRVPVDSLI